MNYKNLRRKLRTSYGLDDMSGHYMHVLSKLKEERLKTHGSEKLKIINAMIELLEEFHESSVRTLQASIERTVLIEKQLERSDFRGTLHEEYHTASKLLKINYHALVRNSKNIANATARYIETHLNHDEKRGLRFGSFGKLYKSIQSYEPAEQKQKKIKKVIEEFGIKSEEIVHEYRDTVLEHFDPSRATDHQNIETQDDRTILRKAILGETLGINVTPFVPNKLEEERGNVVYDELTDEKGSKIGHRYHLHRYMRDDISAGDKIRYIGQIMVATDFGDGHFNEYGVHGHIFSSYDYPNAGSDPTIHLDMPGFSQLTFLYVYFVEQVVEILEDKSDKNQV